MKKLLKILVFIFFSCTFLSITSCQAITSDVMAPAAVTSLEAIAEDGKIILTWKDPSDSDLYAIKIYKSVENSRQVSLEDGILIGKGIQKYEIDNLVDGKTYTFKVSAVDESLNESVPVTSNEVTFFKKIKTVTETVEVEKIVFINAIQSGTYTVYHLHQNTAGGREITDYALKDVEYDKNVIADSTLSNLMKFYVGFTAKVMAQNENVIYIFYDRNIITYTFQTGEQGKFSDGTTEKIICGLYGALYSKPSSPISNDYNFIKWLSNEISAPVVFVEKNMIFVAQWKEKNVDYSTCSIGDIILKDGSIITYDDYDSNSQNAAAVIVRAKNGEVPALGVGIHNKNGLAWCSDNACGYNLNIFCLQGTTISGFIDGCDGWNLMRTFCSDAGQEEIAMLYPVWYFCLKYGSINEMNGDMAEGWYLPTLAELSTIFKNRTIVEKSLIKVGGDTFDSNWYWSSCQCSFNDNYAEEFGFYIGNVASNCKNNNFDYVCSVRAFY